MPDQDVPHHLQPLQLRDFLLGKYAVRNTRDEIVPKLQTMKWPLPGKDFRALEGAAQKKILSDVEAAERFLYTDKVKMAERYLYSGMTTCGLCHTYERTHGEFAPTRIQPTKMPDVWFQSALFNHTVHETADCLQCHQGAGDSTTSADILIPGIDVCRTCHAPSSEVSGNIMAGARYDCAECHTQSHLVQLQ
jgi:hypothetical protein